MKTQPCQCSQISNSSCLLPMLRALVHRHFRGVMEHASFPEECKRYIHPSGSWPSGSQLEWQLRNICCCCGWPAYFHLLIASTATLETIPQVFQFTACLTSWPACGQMPGSICRRLVGGWFLKKQKISKIFSYTYYANLLHNSLSS